MGPKLRKRRLPTELLDRLRMNAALAAEQVMDEHVRSAVEMVEEGAEDAPIERLLAAYARLHHLKEPLAGQLRDRVLATLSRTGTHGGSLDGPRSLFARLRRRLAGRVNAELREWVERQTARVELLIIDHHVQHTLEAVNLLEDHAPVGQAIELYARLLGLRPGVADTVRLKALNALHDREMQDVEQLRPGRTIPYPMRRAENDG